MDKTRLKELRDEADYQGAGGMMMCKGGEMLELLDKASKPRPMVGIGVLIQNGEGKVLLGQRISSHGSGAWCFPGGHLEFGETIFETAKRETLEETGLIVSDFELVSVADERRYIETDGKHYVNIGVRAKHVQGLPQVMEPDKCAGWRWFALDRLPENLLEGTELILQNIKADAIYLPPED